MDYLVDDTTPLIADFLSPSDAINLSRTCSKLHSQLSLTVTRPRQILSKFSKYDCDDYHHYGFEIPILSQAPVHSILISMKYGDQGWGNHKGRVFIVAKNQFDRPGHRCRDLFMEGRVVFSSGIAPHHLQRITIIFKPRQNESYHAWYIVGGGGGHSIQFENVSIQTLVFDDPTHNLKNAHEFLVKNKASLTWDSRSLRPPSRSGLLSDHRQILNTILESTSYSLTHGLQVLPPMISFFKNCGISEENLSLKLIASIKSLWNEWEKELCVYNQANHTDGEEDEDFEQWARTSFRDDTQQYFGDGGVDVAEEINDNRVSVFRRRRRREGTRQVRWRFFDLFRTR